jgi:anti-sigma regulatory factor (Ser/Thr protein kinase)
LRFDPTSGDAKPLRDGKRILIPDLSRPWESSEASQLIIDAIRGGDSEVVLDLTTCDKAYPNTVAPMRSDLDLFESRGLTVRVELSADPPEILKGLAEAHDADPSRTLSDAAYLAGTFRFKESRQVADITSRTVGALSRMEACSPGVLLAIELSLNEIADNVLQHAHTAGGVVSVLLQPERRYLAICVADSGIGILRSFRESGHSIANDTAAIRRAVMEGVTRDPAIGAGNGLWILHELVRANSGGLGIKSGGAIMLLTDLRETFPAGLPFLDEVHRGTSVDFQLDLARAIDVKAALGGYEPINLRLESYEDDEGVPTLRLADFDAGVGTRRAGFAARTLIRNLLNESGTEVRVDFSGVSPSFSFLDEALAKLAEEIGWSDFDARVRAVGLDDVQSGFFARTLEKRRLRSD